MIPEHDPLNPNAITDDEESRTSQKSMRSRIILAVVIFVCAAAVIATIVAVVVKDAQYKEERKTRKQKNQILLVSLDGFRADYLKRGRSPNINRLVKEGVVADFLLSEFPTKTFPNHYSIATGLHPESHGIVANTFLSKDRKEKFKIGGKTTNDGKWWGGEPIWVTAIKQGLKSASYYWVGSEAPVQGIRPSYWRKYNKSVPYQERVKQVLDWMSYEPSDFKPSIVTLYHYMPDGAGHRYGPDSQQTNDAIDLVDDMIGLLSKGLKDRGLADKVNMIVLTDHGMANVDCSRVIYLDQLTSLQNVTVVGQGSFGYIYAKSEDAAKRVFDGIKCSHANLRAFSKSGIYTPKRMHNMNSRHSGEIALVPDNGWTYLVTKNGTCKSSLKGMHGYDNMNTDMQGIFVANGPAFRKGYNAGYFGSVEIYNLLCRLLDLKPAPNNGTDGSLYHLLNNETRKMLPITEPAGDGNNFQERCSSTPSSSCDTKSGCICPYCNHDILKNMSVYQDHLLIDEKTAKQSRETHFPFGLPQGGAGSSSSGCVLTQRHYVTGYSKELHIPLWVGYKLTKKQLEKNVIRKFCFRRDTRLSPADSANCADYSGSGYDRGHMAPNGDFNFERLPEQDTNVFSNIVPQHKAFNRFPGLWFRSEDLIRNWTTQYGPLYIITGSIFDMDNNGLRDKDDAEKRWLHNRKNGVAIPTHFYKIVVRCLKTKTSEYKSPGCPGEVDIIAFVLPHAEEPLCKLRTWQSHLLDYVTTVHDIEKLTGISFFPLLPPTQQAKLKTKLPLKLW